MPTPPRQVPIGDRVPRPAAPIQRPPRDRTGVPSVLCLGFLLWATPSTGFPEGSKDLRPSTDKPQESPAEAQGREWSRRLRTSAPEQPSTNQAVLRIRTREGRRKVPVTVITRPGSDRWSVEYRVAGDGAADPVQVAIIHHHSQGPPSFEVNSPAATRGTADEGRPGAGPKAGDQSVGGSDFLLKELGMEFLHWPEQRILTRELSNGRWCRVLESRSGRADGPAAVRSWIDEKLGVVLSAEVYDSRQVRIKHFSVTQFRELADRWTCSVSMVDDLRGTKTELSFDGPPPR